MVAAGSAPTWPGGSLATLAFAVASATTWWTAGSPRRYELVTSLGKVADPIADKAADRLRPWSCCPGSAKLPWWVTVLILAREWGVTGLRLQGDPAGGVIRASRGGKLKTALQILAIAWYLWPFSAAVEKVGVVIMAGAVVITVATGVAIRN